MGDSKKKHIDVFTIIKQTKFEGKEVFILSNPKERRVVECDRYKDFGLKIGDRVETEFKKANCAGTKMTHIYHPRYKIGQEYNFNIDELGVIEMGGHQMNYADLTDSFGFYQRIRINPDQLPTTAEIATCRVTGMSRGKLHLLLIDK